MPAMKKKYGLGAADDFVDLELPSLSDPDDPKSPHNVCRVRRPGVQGLIAAGVIDNFDSLTAIVEMELAPKAEGRTVAESPTDMAKQATKLMQNMEAMEDALRMMDKVVCYVVVEPKVVMPPEDGERDPDVLYADAVDLGDKTFIMQYAFGGTRDLEAFRAGTGSIVGAMEAKPDVPLPALKPARRRRTA